MVKTSSLGAVLKRGYEEELKRTISPDELDLIIIKRAQKANRSKPILQILKEGW